MRAFPTAAIQGLLLAFPLLLVGGVSTPARAQSASTYQQTCDRIGIAGSTLFAFCRRIDGRYDRTSIGLVGIDNINGTLQYNGTGQPSTFQNSCNAIAVAGASLTARCRRIDGRFDRTSIEIPGIANIDGTLRYQ